MNGTQQRELPYAWVIVALAALIFAVSSGLRSTIGLLVRPWEAEFGWERAAVVLQPRTVLAGLIVGVGRTAMAHAAYSPGVWCSWACPRQPWALSRPCGRCM